MENYNLVYYEQMFMCRVICNKSVNENVLPIQIIAFIS
jgi:hypothetical protein